MNEVLDSENQNSEDKKSPLFLVGIVGGLLAFLPALYGLFYAIIYRPDLLVPYIIGVVSSILALILMFFIERNQKIIGSIVIILAIIIILFCLIGSLGAIILLIVGIIYIVKNMLN